jgi:hypothetical protein
VCGQYFDVVSVLLIELTARAVLERVGSEGCRAVWIGDLGPVKVWCGITGSEPMWTISLMKISYTDRTHFTWFEIERPLSAFSGIFASPTPLNVV